MEARRRMHHAGKRERVGPGPTKSGNQQVALWKRVAQTLFSLTVQHLKNHPVMNGERFIEEFTVKKPFG